MAGQRGLRREQLLAHDAKHGIPHENARDEAEAEEEVLPAHGDKFRLGGAAQRMQVLMETNALLDTLGFGARSFDDYDDLVASVSSMSVALYEKLFQFRLDGVIRVPQTGEDYEANAQLVVDALSGALLDESFDTNAITGATLCAGDVAGIQQLVRMFAQIYTILYSDDPTGGRGDDPSRSDGVSKGEDPAISDKRPVSPAAKKPNASKPTRALKEPVDQSAAQSKAKLPRTSRRVPSTALRGSRSAATTQASAAVTTRRTRRPALPTQKRLPSTRAKPSGKSAAPRQTSRTDPDSEAELLTTRRYGRYVPVPQRTRRRQRSRERYRGGDKWDRGRAFHEEDLDEEAVPMGRAALLADEALAVGETYFAGVSSVSGASGSSASIHFMEEEGEFTHNFSNVQSHSSPGTLSKASPPESGSTPSGGDHGAAAVTTAEAIPMESTVPNEKAHRPRRSRNQEEADESEGQGDDLAARDQQAQTHAEAKEPARRLKPKKSEREGVTASKNRDYQACDRTRLYPLLPETIREDRESKAYRQHLRFKLQLKDHLQELRHRDFCQRQHLERAYRLGEHAANVERIRARRFEQELRLQRVSMGVDAKCHDEKQLRDAMQHLLKLEKQRLQDEHRTTKQMIKQIQKEHAEREDAMENFYKTQIQVVKERTQRELQERETVKKAHQQASAQILREMRRDRERELAALLEQKQHIEDVRRVRHATHLDVALAKSSESSRKQGDAFYAAAMKARQLRATRSPFASRPRASKPATIFGASVSSSSSASSSSSRARGAVHQHVTRLQPRRSRHHIPAQRIRV